MATKYERNIHTATGIERFSFDFNPEYLPENGLWSFCPHTCESCEWERMGQNCSGRAEDARKISPCPKWEISAAAYALCEMERLKDLRRRNNE